MLMLILGIVLLLSGITFLYRSRLSKKFYTNLKDGKIHDYEKVVGTVICDAYASDSRSNLAKPVTPIVEYIVNGEHYETQNAILETGAELPVGTKMYVWYQKENPSQAVLGTELENHSLQAMFGMLMLAFGVILVLLGI